MYFARKLLKGLRPRGWEVTCSQGIRKTCLAGMCRGKVVRFQALGRGCKIVMPVLFNF